MAFSINTNIGAQIALQSLSSIQTSLAKTEKQVSTGLKVADPTDNAAVFSVAQGIRSNLAGYDAINSSLNDGQSAVSVALAGVTSISNLIGNITSTLSALADGSISDQQRQSYTQQLSNQVQEGNKFLDGASYNNINLISANHGNYLPGQFSNFTAPTSITLLSGIDGQQLTIAAQDLTGGTAGTDGFLGLSRLVYYVASAPGGATSTVYDTVANAVIGTPVYSRSEIGSFEAIAALAPLSLSASAYSTAAGASGVPSVFGSAVASFQLQVDTALSALGADYDNIQTQITFVQSLSDASNIGLGNLVDANLAETSAQLTALQTQQQLATQALSIANSQPKTILQLFQQ